MRTLFKAKIVWVAVGFLFGTVAMYTFMMIRVRSEWGYEKKLLERIEQLELRAN